MATIPTHSDACRVDLTADVPEEIMADVLSVRFMRPSVVALACLVCRRWARVGGDVLARERRRMAAEACQPGGLCAHQWAATAALASALTDDNVGALLRVLDTDIIGPDDLIDPHGWNRLKMETTTPQLASVSVHDGEALFDWFALSDMGDGDIAFTSLVMTPLVMAFAYGAPRCARVLIDRGARPMPHVDALVTFLIHRFACREARVVQPLPGHRWYAANVTIAPLRPDQPSLVDVLAMVLETFPRGPRAPLGIVPPLKALVMAVSGRLDEELGATDIDQSGMTRDATQLARLLMEAGYNPRTSWRCRGPREMTRMLVGCPIGLAPVPPQEATRLDALEKLVSETPYDAAAWAADDLRSRRGLASDALDALAEVYAGRPAPLTAASRDKAADIP
ncbi:hypothetical protein psal_cds_904 [Pandoravirus salinus]|uniref:F-box incomplete domain containing protein n=1 Tax=Pandoravirus salinus TaxID=1349410 RepID=S4W3Z0_9VIRU|nr:hypothetical protein psal_cds_904 [Pandoravirus salinus]AGO85010.1 hypothetical protein psal_cds_904 [Pandoravirus salinus]